MALLVEAGLTPLESLQAATRNAARAARLGDDLGTVEARKLADLVLLKADPLVDVANTTRIAGVVAHGRLLEAPARRGLLGAAEGAAMPVGSAAPYGRWYMAHASVSHVLKKLPGIPLTTRHHRIECPY